MFDAFRSILAEFRKGIKAFGARFFYFYLPRDVDIVFLTFALLLGSFGIFLSLSTFGAHSSEIFTNSLKNGSGVIRSIYTYSAVNPVGFWRLVRFSLVAGILSALLFFYPVWSESKARFVRFLSLGLQRVNDLSYALTVIRLEHVDQNWFEGFTNQAINTLMFISRAYFVVVSLADENGSFETYSTAGWGCPRIGTTDDHSLNFVAPHTFYVPHSGQYGRTILGVRVSPPSIGVKIIDPRDESIFGIIWISGRFPEPLSQPIERITKLTANIISLAFLKFLMADNESKIETIHLKVADALSDGEISAAAADALEKIIYPPSEEPESQSPGASEQTSEI